MQSQILNENKIFELPSIRQRIALISSPGPGSRNLRDRSNLPLTKADFTLSKNSEDGRAASAVVASFYSG